MTFPKYPEYKDSGVEWLGEVPAHWVVSPFKWQIDANDGGAWGEDPLGDNDTYVLRSTDQTVDGRWKITEPALRHLSPKEQASTVLKAGDLVVTKSSGSSLHIGKTTLVDKCMASKGFSFGNFMQRIRTKRSFLPKLAWYFMNNAVARLQLDLLSNSTTGLANLNGTIIGEVKVATPPQKEQTDIVAFLDHETSRIDALVEEQQRLIGLLKEKRQAVISHAVTKGLDPDVPMKDSGVEWLGEVPAHWDTPRLKHVADAQGGSTPSKEREDYWMGDIPWVSPKDMKRDVITKTIDNVSEEAVVDSGLKVVPCRSVLVVVRGMILAHTFPVALSGANVTINQDMKAIIPACDRLLPEYLQLLLRGIDEVIFDCIDSSAHGTKKLQWEEFFNTQVPLPSLDEQLRISSGVQAELDQLEQLTSQAQLMASTLSERRSALISATVTGKIDVRGWQPPAGLTASTEATQTEAV